MVYQAGILADTEDKENLELERRNLIEFLEETKQLLHIKNLKYVNIDNVKNEYIRQHAWLSKDELIIRTGVLEDVYNFLIQCMEESIWVAK